MKKFVCAMLLGSLAFVALADSYDENLKKHGITKITSMYDLAEFTGNRVFQVQGTIQGVCSSDQGCMFSIQTPEGIPLQVSSSAPLADWMLASNVTARFLVRIEKNDEMATPQAYLISAKQSTLVSLSGAPIAKINTPPKKAEVKPVKKDRRQPEPMRGTIAMTSRGGATARNARSSTHEWTLEPNEATPYYRDFILSQNRHLSYEEANGIASCIVNFSIKFDVDARLITALVMSESNFNPRDVSHTGATGLGQLMADTARELGVTDRFNTEENVYATVKLLKQHMDKYTRQTGSEVEGLRLALAAYNAGPGAVSRAGGVPPYRETQNYVKKVVRIYKQLAGLD